MIASKELVQDPRRLEAILADFGAEDKLGCNLVLCARRARLPETPESSLAPKEAGAFAAECLMSSYGLSEIAAR